MARRTFADYKASVTHALGAAPATGVTTANMVNDAMKHLVAMRSWYWLRGAQAYLDLRGPIAFTDGTWEESTKKLTATLTGYTAVAVGDTVNITDGTGVTAGLYTIASLDTSEAVIVLDDSLATAGGDLATGDITGSIEFPYVELPADFGEEVAITYPGSFARDMVRTTMEDIMRLRANPISSVNFTFRYAINTGMGPASPQSSPNPLAGLSNARLELYPAPEADSANAIAVTYRRELKEMGSDTDVPLIPEWLDYPLDLLCRSFAMTLEDDNPNNSAQQMFERIWPSLIRRDQAVQARRGPMKGGLAPYPSSISPFYPSSIGDPS